MSEFVRRRWASIAAGALAVAMLVMTGLPTLPAAPFDWLLIGIGLVLGIGTLLIPLPSRLSERVPATIAALSLGLYFLSRGDTDAIAIAAAEAWVLGALLVLVWDLVADTKAAQLPV